MHFLWCQLINRDALLVVPATLLPAVAGFNQLWNPILIDAIGVPDVTNELWNPILIEAISVPDVINELWNPILIEAISVPDVTNELWNPTLIEIIVYQTSLLVVKSNFDGISVPDVTEMWNPILIEAINVPDISN